MALDTRPDLDAEPLRAWWRRPWLVPLAVLVAAFLGYTLPRYLGFDRALTPVVLRFSMQYWIVVAHVLCGSLTLVTACVQVWPALREQYPAVHRWVGRVHVWGGVLPTGLLALILAPFSHGPAGNFVAAVLWLLATGAGIRAARQRRYADHRTWMVYSFALTMSFLWGRVMFMALPMMPGFDPADPHTMTVTFDTASWIGVFINLIAAYGWLQWTQRRVRVPALAA
jgi:hypothetical protein